MKKSIVAALMSAFTLWPMAQAQNPNGLTLAQYLDQVKAKGPQARYLVENVAALELRMDEGNVVTMPEAYFNYNYLDDKKQTSNPNFTGDRVRGQEMRLGVRTQTTIGLGANLYFNSAHTNINNALAFAVPEPDYRDTRAVLELSQSLWRNSFGEGTRAQVKVANARVQADLAAARYQLKNLLMDAEDTYWSVVSYNDIVVLQEGNVDRGRKLFDWMTKRTKMRLYDDVDQMQAQALLETRQLELQTSMDQRAALARKFNSLRGSNSDTVEELAGLPSQTGMLDLEKKSTKRFSREDFDIIRAQAAVADASATAQKATVDPIVDLKASIATSGHDIDNRAAYYEVQTDRYPIWSVGVNLVVPLDFGLTGALKRAARGTKRAAAEANAQADFDEARVWDDLLKQKKDAVGRFQRAVSLENLQTRLVKSERQRLLNGRTTTFQLSRFDQDLAGAQVQRIQAQLALLKIHNLIKTFEVRP